HHCGSPEPGAECGLAQAPGRPCEGQLGCAGGTAGAGQGAGFRHGCCEAVRTLTGSATGRGAASGLDGGDLGRAVMTLEFVIDLRLVLQARTLRQQITDLAQKLAGTSSLNAGGLHQLSALVTYLPLVRVQDEPSSPTWCWREVKLQLQPAVLQCLHGLTLPYTVTSGAPGEDGAVQSATLDLPTCLALCTCAAFLTSEPLAASAPGLPGNHLAQATAPGSLPSTEVADQSGSLTLPRQLASEEAGGGDSSPLTQATLQTGILQLPPQVTLALTCALQQLRDFALTPHTKKTDIAAGTTDAGSAGHSALHQQLQALGWAHALTLTLPASPAGASKEQHQAATQDVPLDLPSSAGCVAWPGPIPGKQLAAVLDLQQLAKLQAASHKDYQAELFRLHLRLGEVCHAWCAGEALISLPHQPSGLQWDDDAQQAPPGPWCMQLVIACSQDKAFSDSPQYLPQPGTLAAGCPDGPHCAAPPPSSVPTGGCGPGPGWVLGRVPWRVQGDPGGLLPRCCDLPTVPMEPLTLLHSRPALTEELWANGGSTKPGTTAKTSSPQAFNLQQASGTVSTLLRLAWQGCALHHYTAIEDIDSIEGFLHTTACLLPLLAPTKQPGQDEDWATALSPLGTEPEAVQALRCLMMDQVMSCAVQLALSVQQPGNHNGFSGTAQQGQPQSLGAETVLQVLEAMSGVGLLAPPLLLRHVPDNPLSVAPAPPAATQASAPTTDYQVQQHLEAAARAAELEEGGRERGSAAQLAAWPPSLRDQVQAQLLCSQAWPAGWVSVVDALVGRMCADIAHTPDLLTLPQLAGILRKLQAAGYAPAQGPPCPAGPAQRTPSQLVLQDHAGAAGVRGDEGAALTAGTGPGAGPAGTHAAAGCTCQGEYKDARSWEEVWAVPCLALTTRPSPTGSWPESLTQPRTWGSISSLHPMQIIDYGFHASHMKMVPCNTWLLLRQVITVQAAGFPFIGGRTLQSWTQLLLKQLAACANTLYGWRKEVELLRGSLLMTTAEQLVLGDDIASMDDYTVLACQLTGRCSQYLPASHFFQVLGTLYLVSNLAQHITTFAMAGMILAKEDGAQLSYYNCLAGPPQASSATHMLGIWQDIMQQLEPGRLMQQQALQPFCLIPPSAINSLLRLGLRALGSEHGGSSSSGGAVGAARAAGTLEGGAVGKGHDSFIAMLFNGGPQVVGRYDSFWRASLLYAVAKRHPEAEAGLLQQALERLLVSYNAMSIKAIVMPLEALLVVLEPHLCPASPNTAPAPLPEELPIQQWLMMADWSNFQYPSLTTRWVTDDGSLMSEWRSWGPRQWALLFSLWINCPPFKTLFLDCLVEEQLIMMLTRGTAPRSPPPSSDGSRNGRLTGAQALGGQAQPADEPSMQHSPEAPVDPTGLQEAELALALVRMGLPGNMFERGAPLQPDLQQRLVQWGRWEWYIDLLRYYRLGGLHDNDTIPILTLQFAMEREGTCLEAVHLAGCPQDLHTQLRLPKSWPVSNDSISARQLQFWATPALGTSTEQLRQVFMDTADALQQLPGSAAFGPRFMAAVAGIQSHRRKLCEMYAAPRSGSRSGSSSDPGPPWAGDPSPNSPTAFKRDVSLTLGADFLLGCALTNTTDARLTIDVTQQMIA
ncbi:hypothetical protein HaLaN_08894, partial [Haematococcus lacustris]